MPEPWATRLVQEGGGKVLVDERTLWPQGQFVTTHLVVRNEVPRQAHPDVVERLLEGQVAANDYINAEPGRRPEGGQRPRSSRSRQKPLEATRVVAAPWKNMTFTNDPIASSLADVGRQRRRRSGCSTSRRPRPASTT